MFIIYFSYSSLTNQTKKGQQCYFPVCFLNVEVIVAVVFLALSDSKHREQLPDR